MNHTYVALYIAVFVIFWDVQKLDMGGVFQYWV